MVKAKELWKHLCEELNYKLFAGVPCLGLNNLYKVINKSDMVYIQAANERIALGVVSGVLLSGSMARQGKCTTYGGRFPFISFHELPLSPLFQMPFEYVPA